MSNTSTTIRTTLHFNTSAEANNFINALQNLRSYRLADYGTDEKSGVYLTIDELRFPNLYTQTQLERWKACGCLTL